MKTVDFKKKLEILLSCAGLAVCSLGLIINVNGVFFKPISEALGVGRGAISLTSTLTTLATGFASVYALKIVNRSGLKKVLIISVLITVLSTAGIAFSKNLMIIYLLSVIRGIASCFFNTPVVTMIIGNWFITGRGTYSGIVMAFSGLGGAVMSPVLSRIIEKYDYRISLLFSVLMMILVCLPALFFLKASPEEAGYRPYLKEEENEIRKKQSYEIVFRKDSLDFFLLMIIAFLCQATCSIAQHLSGYGESLGYLSSQGAFMISVAMIGNISGKFLVGFLSDRIGELKSGLVLVSSFALGLILLFLHNGYLMLLIGSLLLGFSYACAVMLSNVTFAVYGNVQYGDAYGLLTLIINIGGALSVAL
ncbi:MAG: MFS transporter, partial [Erysipelotrichaceae bacterium]|nr:MFS transporter [Erysipelotrichaceae bacterium]